LSKDARHPVFQAAKPFIRSGQKILKKGTSLREDGEPEESLQYFREVTSIFQEVSQRLEVVNYEVDKLDDLLDTTKQYHDTTAIESAKDSINYYLLRAKQHEREGDQKSPDRSGGGAEEYGNAKDAIKEAIDVARTYNDSRLWSDSPAISLEPLNEKLDTIDQKLKNSTNPDSPSFDNSGNPNSAGTQRKSTLVSDSSPETIGDTPNDASKRERLLDEIEKLTDDLGKVPSSTEMKQEGEYDPDEYSSEFGTWKDAVEEADVDIVSDLESDLRSVADEVGKPPSTGEVNEHGKYDVSRYWRYFDWWQDALDAAGIDPEEATNHDLAEEDSKHTGSCTSNSNSSGSTSDPTQNYGRLSISQLKERLDEFYTEDQTEEGNWYRCRRTTEDGGTCNTKVYFSENTTEDLRNHETKHFDPDRQKSPAQNSGVASSSVSGGTHPGGSNVSDPSWESILEESAFENSWETIPDNSRLEGQLLVKVKNIVTPKGDRKSHLLELVDRTGRTVNLDVWETHGLDIDWPEGEWCAVSNTRGTVWETDSDGVQKRLSSTKDLEVIPLGDEFDPEDVRDQIQKTRTESGSRDKTPSDDGPSRTRQGGTGTNSTTSTQTASSVQDGADDGSIEADELEEEDGIFEDIVSDFEDL
jgi:hypothetical protein